METSGPRHQDLIKTQFTQAAEAFAERSSGRFDVLNVVDFSRMEPGQTVIEAGAGTANFISLFSEVAGLTAAFDLTSAMLLVARDKHPGVELVAADGMRLPLRSGSVDLATTAQALHHIFQPVEVLKELRRVVRPGGRVLVVDSVTTESIEEALAMNELDLLRDPSHAAFRSPSTMKVLVQAAGLSIVDEHLSVGQQRLSEWIWPGEFAEGTLDKVRRFIEQRGHETGMKFESDGEDWVFERRRLMLLCAKQGLFK